MRITATAYENSFCQKCMQVDLSEFSASHAKILWTSFFLWHSHYVFHFHVFIFSNTKHTCTVVCSLSFMSAQLQNVLMQCTYSLCPKYSVHAWKYLNCSYIARSVITTIVLECPCNSLHASLLF